MDNLTVIVSACVTLALIVAYVVISVTGHDGEALLGVLAGWIGGTSLHPVTKAVQGATGSGGDIGG